MELNTLRQKNSIARNATHLFPLLYDPFRASWIGADNLFSGLFKNVIMLRTLFLLNDETLNQFTRILQERAIAPNMNRKIYARTKN